MKWLKWPDPKTVDDGSAQVLNLISAELDMREKVETKACGIGVRLEVRWCEVKTCTPHTTHRAHSTTLESIDPVDPHIHSHADRFLLSSVILHIN
jgi:hypothetical protein